MTAKIIQFPDCPICERRRIACVCREQLVRCEVCNQYLPESEVGRGEMWDIYGEELETDVCFNCGGEQPCANSAGC